MGPNFEFFGPNTQCGPNSDPCRVWFDSIWLPSSCRPCLVWRLLFCISINFAEVCSFHMICPLCITHDVMSEIQPHSQRSVSQMCKGSLHVSTMLLLKKGRLEKLLVPGRFSGSIECGSSVKVCRVANWNVPSRWKVVTWGVDRMGVRGCYDGVPLVINRRVCLGPKSSGMLSIENFLI